MPDGRIEPRQVDVLNGVGAWLAGHGESIYGTRGGPYKPGPFGASTRRGNLIYLHVFAWPGPTLRLPPLPAKVIAGRVLGGGAATVTQTATGLEISVAAADRHPADTVVVLELNGPAAGIAPIEVPPGASK
jgi:alpha-L-fucosidase